eukprot:GFYU01002324.1.p1 GENE.GFYU01002324.1~~GFYU01002324.1.p1  ORF type:complete len:309 (-),score=45.20 GFYU01002324.1:556-1482(-)
MGASATEYQKRWADFIQANVEDTAGVTITLPPLEGDEAIEWDEVNCKLQGVTTKDNVTCLAIQDLAGRTRVPACVWLACPNLVELDIADNRCTQFPDIATLKTLSSLRKLLVSNVVDIPAGIGALTDLTELRVTASAVTGVPASMGLLKSLETLDLHSLPTDVPLPGVLMHLRHTLRDVYIGEGCDVEGDVGDVAWSSLPVVPTDNVSVVEAVGKVFESVGESLHPASTADVDAWRRVDGCFECGRHTGDKTQGENDTRTELRQLVHVHELNYTDESSLPCSLSYTFSFNVCSEACMKKVLETQYLRT